MADRTLRLKDGRRVGYAEYGVPDGTPVLFCHGFGDSRLFGQLFDADSRRYGVRLILPERPGYGLSDFQPKRTLLEWPDDAAQILDQLGVEQVGLVGFSGGAPYLAACCYTMPERVTKTTILSGIAPQDRTDTWDGTPRFMRFLLNLVSRAPRLAEVALSLTMVRAFRANPERQSDRLAAFAPEADRKVYHDPRIRPVMIQNTLEAFRQGAQGAAWDMALLVRPWGFDPAAIQTPVALWHGEADMTVPVANGRYMAKTLPDCAATFLPGQAHLSTVIRYMPYALAAVCS